MNYSAKHNILHRSAKEVAAYMNRLGQKNYPFLFGFDFEMQKGFLIKNPLHCHNVLFRIPGVRNYNPTKFLNTELQCEMNIEKQYCHKTYAKQFNKVIDSIKMGNSYLCNLTISTPIRLNVNLAQLFLKSHSAYGLCFRDEFISFSPERFVSISDGVIRSNPMKGTIDASISDARLLLGSDYKEDCEHNTIVDLIRNDLGKLASHIRVERFKYIESIKTDRGELLQMSSEITGRLPEGYTAMLGDIFLELLPAGSVSGAPKPATLSLISEAESTHRGYYTGVFGYFDGTNLDSAVLIRYIENRNGKYYYRSGGGITINSSIENEYREALQKIYIPSM